MKNFGDLMKQAGQMQAKLEAMQQELAETEHEGRAGAGLVSVTVASEVEVLEDLIVAAFADARTKVEAHQQEEMSKLTGGLNLPGGLKLPF